MKARYAQVRNPRTGRYVKVDRYEGKVVGHKKSDGPYRGIKIARRR